MLLPMPAFVVSPAGTFMFAVVGAALSFLPLWVYPPGFGVIVTSAP